VDATEEDPQRGEGKRNTVAWGLLVPRQQQERVSHEMGLSALQKKKKWASLVVRQPGLVIHPTSWTLCVFFFFFLSMDPFVAVNNRGESGDYKQGRRLLVGSLDWKEGRKEENEEEDDVFFLMKQKRMML